MSVTIKDVAKAAGVSVATVSRVLNNSAAVSDETAAAVNDTIRELGYSPNFLGRNLRKCETNNILAIIPSTEQSFYSEIIKGMQEEANPDYDILICTSYSYLGTEMRLLEMLYNRTVDAAVLLGTQLDAAALDELSEKYSLALCCERVEGAKVLSVAINDEAAGYDAVCAFLKKGRRRIGLVTTGADGNAALTSVDREKGYRRALAEFGIKVNEEYIFRGNYDYEQGLAAFDYFYSLPEPPDAVFCVSDLLAAGVIRRAGERGVKVGSELWVCGFDNISLSRMYIPGITTVAQPGYEMGRTVIRRLVENMRLGKHSCENVILEHELIIRQSGG
ncbi:MAG: LacI family DNA-binding transcriptional regulator [Oscillospiraceae bacterium]|nr:LacI family DNA-binding transcriptional regulator [Oscillospiraceae bacterium]